jgi:uncharacterized protein (DUF1919 family)
MTSNEESLNYKIVDLVDLHFSYKVCLHPSSYKKGIIFWKRIDLQPSYDMTVEL